MDWHPFDKGGKWLLQHHGNSILRLGGVGDVAAWRALQAEVVQPGQLPDGLIEAHVEGQAQPVYVAVELATKAEKRLTGQVVRDMMLVYLDRGVLPEMLTVVLQQRGNYRAAAEARLQSRLGLSRCHLTWRVVELWTLSAEELLEAKDVGVIPWVPLTHFGGPPDRLLRRCRERIEQQAPPEERVNLLALTQVMARLRYPDPQLLTLLGGARVMIESPLITELLAKNTAETKQKDIVRLLRGRFGAVPEELASALGAIQGEAQLDALFDSAIACPDLEAFRARLQAPTRPGSPKARRRRKT